MPKLISPTGETVSVSHAGARVLVARGYVNPNKPSAKKRGGKQTAAAAAPAIDESPEEAAAESAESTDEPTEG